MKNNTLSQDKTNSKGLFVLMGLMGAYLVLQSAGATGGEEEFGEIYDKLTEWSQGTLGKLMALLCVVVGTAYTISKGTLIWAVLGVAMCLVLYNAPTIIDSLMGATLPLIETVTNGQIPIAEITNISNGMVK